MDELIENPDRAYVISIGHKQLGKLARRLIVDRRKREAQFPSLLFSDPAWDMLLDLFAAETEDKKISVTSLGIASAAPQTTAHRWIETLEEQNLIKRRRDSDDGRRMYVKLSALGYDRMHSYLSEVSAEWSDI